MSSSNASSDSGSSRPSEIEELRVLFEEHLKLAKSKETSEEAKDVAKNIIGRTKALIDPLFATKKQQKNALDAFKGFLNHKNKEMVSKALEYINQGQFDALLTSFSSVKNQHMTRMKVEIKEPEPFSSVMKKKNEIAAFAHFQSRHQELEPTEANLDALIRLEYPKYPDNVIPMSEIIAKHKVIQFFRLADQGQEDQEDKDLYREFCWVLLPELTLFRLTGHSHPSEVLTSLETRQNQSSTFLTGITDMMWVSLVQKEEGSNTLRVSQGIRQRIAGQLLSVFTKQGTAPTYEAVYNITQSYLSELDGEFNWEFLMIEVKRAKDPRESSLSTGLPQVIEDRGQEPDQNENSIEAENRGSNENGVLQPQDIEVEGELTDLQKWLGLKEFLPQVISQCLAVETGKPSLEQKIIKFILTDGNNWIFGIVNCSDGSDGRKCYSTNFRIRPEQRETLKAQMKQVLELLILWALSPAELLQRLFTTV